MRNIDNIFVQLVQTDNFIKQAGTQPAPTNKVTNRGILPSNYNVTDMWQMALPSSIKDNIEQIPGTDFNSKAFQYVKRILPYKNNLQDTIEETIPPHLQKPINDFTVSNEIYKIWPKHSPEFKQRPFFRNVANIPSRVASAHNNITKATGDSTRLRSELIRRAMHGSSQLDAELDYRRRNSKLPTHMILPYQLEKEMAGVPGTSLKRKFKNYAIANAQNDPIKKFMRREKFRYDVNRLWPSGEPEFREKPLDLKIKSFLNRYDALRTGKEQKALSLYHNPPADLSIQVMKNYGSNFNPLNNL